MALVPHKITALAESDADGTDGKNIIAGAVVSLFDSSGAAVTLFDDEAGNNGSTAKQTDASGQVVVWVTPGEYSESVNGSPQRAVTIGGRTITSYPNTESLQNSRPTQTGQRAENRERANAQYELAASGYAAQPGDIVAANGRIWALIINNPASVFHFGVKNGEDSTVALQDAFESRANELNFDGADTFASSIKINRSIALSGKGKITHSIEASAPLIDINSSDIDVSINDLELDGNRASQPAEFQGALLRLSSFSSRTSNVTLKVSCVSFKNMSGFGCLLYGDFTSESGHDVSIKDCLFDGINEGNSSSYNPCQIFAADGIETLSVTGNVFKSGYDFSTFGACAFQLTSTNPASRATSNVTFSGNTSYGMGRSAANGLGALDVYVWGENLIITDNRMVDSFSPGLRAKASSENVIISNNHVINTQNNYEAISFANTTTGVCYGSLTVTGNVVDGANNGIFIEGATTDSFEEVTCNSNVVKNVTNDGINLNNIENFTVNGNVVKSTGRYGIFIKTWWGTANVSNNSIDTTGNIGIYSTWLNINYGESMVISGNAIKNPTTRGIQVVYSSALNISDNVINATTVGDGIRIDDVQDAYVVADNIVLGATTPFAALNSAGAIAKVNNNSWQ